MVSKILQDVSQHIAIRPQYDNFIGGKWVAACRRPVFRQYLADRRQVVCKVARSGAADVDLRLDAAHAARRHGAARQRPSARGCC